MSSKLINYFLDCEKSLVDLISEIKIFLLLLWMGAMTRRYTSTQACGQSREFPSIFIGVSVKGVARKSRREKRGPTNSSSRTSALSDEELL